MDRDDLLQCPAQRVDAVLAEVPPPLLFDAPDVVIHLDLAVDEVLRRVCDREQPAELHEIGERLSMVRNEYEAVLGWLATQPSPIAVHRIDCGTSRTVGEIATEVADRLDARVLIATG